MQAKKRKQLASSLQSSQFQTNQTLKFIKNARYTLSDFVCYLRIHQFSSI